MQQLAVRLEAMHEAHTDAGKFAVPAELPAIVFFNAVSWNSAVQRQHHFARGIAQLGHPVLWVEPLLSPVRCWETTRPLQQVAPGVHLLRLPANARDIYHMNWTLATEAAMVAALIQTASVYGMQHSISLVNYPRWYPIVKCLRERCGWSVAFDCLDDQRALAEIYQTPLLHEEDSLVEEADLILTSSAILQQRLHPRSSILLQNACDYDLFSSPSLPAGLHLPRPVVGFFGALADWLDMDLIHAAALRFPAWSFVYIGPQAFSNADMERKWLRSINLPNITALPLMDQRTLAAHLADFDVCTMPFLDIPVTRSMNAVKLYEYLAAGKPAVSRDLPEIRHLLNDPQAEGLVVLYNTPQKFYEQLQSALALDSPQMIARRKSFAQHNDWSERIDVLSNSLTQLAHNTSSINASSRGSKTRSQE
jgi:glycosyltransferase involved in cell wall biosynthesis